MADTDSTNDLAPVRLKSSLLLREEGDEGAILYDYDNANFVFLNPTGAAIVRFCQEHCDNLLDPESLIEVFKEKYGDDFRESIEKDVPAYVSQLRRANMLAAAASALDEAATESPSDAS